MHLRNGSLIRNLPIFGIIEKHVLNATNKNERAIKTKMKSLLDALCEVNACYTCWASRSRLTDEALSSPTEKYSTG